MRIRITLTMSHTVDVDEEDYPRKVTKQDIIDSLVSDAYNDVLSFMTLSTNLEIHGEEVEQTTEEKEDAPQKETFSFLPAPTEMIGDIDA